VSSEKAIPYLAKTLRGRTKVLRYSRWQLRVALVTAAAAHALGRGWQDGGILVAKGRGQVRQIKRGCKPCPRYRHSLLNSARSKRDNPAIIGKFLLPPSGSPGRTEVHILLFSDLQSCATNLIALQELRLLRRAVELIHSVLLWF
jgi:hypothetical protein